MCSLPALIIRSITVTVDVANNAAASITNTANVSGGGQTNTANDTATDVTAVTQMPDLTVNKSHAGNFSQGQVGAQYSIVVTNSGFATTNGTVTVTDTLPAGLTPTAPIGPYSGWTCGIASQTLTCTRNSTRGPGTSFPAINLTVNVAANAPASVTNSVTVSGGGQTNTSNDTDTDPTTIVQPDLTIAKSHVGNFSQGQVGAQYTITATNSGTASTNGSVVTVTDTLPVGLTATAISGTGWVCVLGTLTCTRNTVLAAGSSYPAITLTVTVANSAPASVTNSVSVSGGGQTNTANDTATDPTTINHPDLTVTKSHAGNFTQGQVGSYLHAHGYELRRRSHQRQHRNRHRHLAGRINGHCHQRHRSLGLRARHAHLYAQRCAGCRRQLFPNHCHRHRRQQRSGQCD